MSEACGEGKALSPVALASSAPSFFNFIGTKNGCAGRKIANKGIGVVYESRRKTATNEKNCAGFDGGNGKEIPCLENGAPAAALRAKDGSAFPGDDRANGTQRN